MSIALTYYGRLPGLNEMIGINRSNKFMGAKMKKGGQQELANIFYLQANGEKITGHSTVYIRFYERDNRRDDDNVIGGGCKLLLDALTQAKIVPDDSPKYVHLKAERFTVTGSQKYRARNSRIEIDIVPDGDDIPMRKINDPVKDTIDDEGELPDLPVRKCKNCGRLFKPFVRDPETKNLGGLECCCIACTCEWMKKGGDDD